MSERATARQTEFRRFGLLTAILAVAAATGFAAEPPRPPATSAPAAGTTAPAQPVPAVSGARFVIGDGYLRLLPGVTGGKADVTVTAEQLDSPAMAASIVLEDVSQGGTSGPAEVTFQLVGERAAGSTSRSWLFAATIKALPLNTEQVRQARIRLGASDRIVQYVLTNRYPTPPEFTLDAPPRWNLWRGGDDSALGITVAAPAQSISGVRVALSKVVDPATGNLIDVASLELCEKPSGPCVTPGPVPGQTTRTLFLRAGSHVGNGRYQGPLLFAADGRAEPKSVNLEVMVSSLCAKLLGGALIVLGVFFAWLVTVGLRAYWTHANALKTVLAAREQFQVVKSEVEQAPKDLQDVLDPLRRRVDGLLMVFDTKILGLLPPRFPGFYNASWNPVALSDELKKMEGPIAALVHIVRHGVDPLVLRWSKQQEEKGRDAYREAIKKLAVAGAAAGDEDAARKAVAAAEASLQAYESMGDSESRSLTTEQIAVQLEIINALGWSIHGVLVCVVGIAVLLLMNPGFGAWLDYVYCFLWGFGLPIASTELVKVTPSNVHAALSVKLPAQGT